MLSSIIRFSVRNKLIIGLFTIGLIVWGVLELRRLPVDALPDITSNQVQVITISPTLAAPEVERLITFPLEQASANIPGIVEMRSISRFGLSVITVVFSDDTDLYWARQQVSERLSQARDLIPREAGNPELAPATTGIGEVYQYVLRPKPGYEAQYDLAELRSIQDWVVRRQLIGTAGVADVSSFGGYLKQYEIAVIPSRLKSMNVTMADLFDALENNNQNSGGAYIEKGPNALFIRTEGLATSLEDLGKVVVRSTSSGIPVYLKDVATLRIGHAIRYGAMTYKDQGEVSGAVVLMLKGANASEVVAAVKTRIEQIKKTLPEGVVLETFYDRTKMVDRAIGTVKNNLLEGALIVVFVLVLFLGNLRAGLIVASVIPLAMLFAIIMMNLFGVSGNLMSLGALDFGLIVDGAVIIVEAVLHLLAHNKQFRELSRIGQPQLDDVVQSAAGRMMNTAVFGQVIILIVYLPILSLTGIEGKMFRPMAQTVSFALIGAFLLSLTYVPMVSALFLSKKIRHTETFSDRLMRKVQKLYKPLLTGALRFPKLVVGISLLVFACASFLLTRLGGEFIPELEEGDFAVDARLIPGSSLTETIAATQKAVAVLQANFPEVEKIVTRVGASEIPTDPMPLEMTDIMITLKPKSTWTSAKSFDELANKMSTALEVVPGLTFGFQFPVQMRFNELISGARQDVVCKIFGENLDSLSAIAHRMGQLVSTVEGARDIYVEAATGLPQIVIRYNRDALAHYQLQVSAINRLVRAAFAGEPAGLIYENERRYDLVVRLAESGRRDISDVSSLLIPTPLGTQVPLYQVATIEIQQGPNQIQREDAQRRIMVGFNVRGRDVESVVQELEAKVEKQAKLPSGYHIKYGGQFENLVEAKQRLYIAVPAALLLILVLLYFAFGSLKLGLLIFTAIPLSAIGGVLALYLRGMPFSISAGVGFIALFGVAVLNGIVLIAEFNRLRSQGLTNIKDLVMEGTRVRLRPVLMTAAVASLGFLPMALSHGAGAEVQRPLATVVIGGLLTATFLTLVVLPVLYTWMHKTGTKLAAVALLLLFANSSQAQTPKTLDALLQQAEQNRSLRIIKQEGRYWEALQQHVFDPGRTQVVAEYGGINSPRKDTRFNISQRIGLPVVYQSQRSLYQASAQLNKDWYQWKKAEWEREIRISFYELVNQQERLILLRQLDSIYTRFREVATLRLQAGEANLLEKTSAEAQWQQLQLQRESLLSDTRLQQLRLQWLTNGPDSILPVYSSPKMASQLLLDTNLLATHPELLYQQQQEQLAAARTAMEKASLKPEFTIGYGNQSIIGYYSPDGIAQTFYGAGKRFHLVNLGIDIPLFNRAAKARVKASESKTLQAKMETQQKEEQLKNQLQQQQAIASTALQHLNYFEQSGLPQANLMMASARLAFENGELGYVEWTLLMNNAVTLKLQYLDALARYNQSMIEIEYLTGK